MEQLLVLLEEVDEDVEKLLQGNGGKCKQGLTIEK